VRNESKILLLDSGQDGPNDLVEALPQGCEAVVAHGLADALRLFHEQKFDGVFLRTDGAGDFLQASVFPAARLWNELPDGVALLRSDLTVAWGNRQFFQWCTEVDAADRNFYEALGSPEILGPDFCPLHTTLASRRPSRSTLRLGENRFFQVHATPLEDTGAGDRLLLLVQLRDVTAQLQQQQKFDAIHRAGIELADLCPEELQRMDVHDRVELLKSKIIHYTKDLLQFEKIEIRLIDRETGRLDPLLAVGMTDKAMGRDLFAEPQGNGVTGFVAATGKSYLCDDTANDPLYLQGAPGACSSLTVPLLLHDEVIGTFNVESPEPGAFSEDDLKFLEIFSRDVAAALNTLELLVAEKMTTTTASFEAIHREIALPADAILIDAAWVLERYIGHAPELAERLQRILQNTREIRQLIQKVGEELAPSVAHPPLPVRSERPALRSKRLLVVDNDDSVVQAAHALLERYGCLIESAHDGQEAVVMARTGQYDLVLADVRLPDMSGYDCFCKVREVLDDVPVILMTGFGYDPSHSIVNARREGLQHVLYKPFRVDQLLQAVEDELKRPRPAPVSHADGDG
jgi:CheY-like chemotaxis protein/GAF domain-containing protein